MAKRWIQKAIKKPGSLTKQAKAAGFDSWQGFCNSDAAKKNPKTVKRCNLAKTLSKMNK